MTRGKIMSNRSRTAALLPALIAAMLAGCWSAKAQQPGAPAAAQAKPPAAAKPATPKPTTAAAPAAAAPAAPAASPAVPQPTLLGMYGDWGAYWATPGGKKVCFVIAKPASSQTNPPNRPRDPAYLFVSSRPAEKVKDEVSIIFGYGLKPNTDASVQISGASYLMYTQADGAWVKNAAEETRLVDAMRKGQDLRVKGTSAKGTASTDVYSLKGLPQALDRVGQECSR